MTDNQLTIVIAGIAPTLAALGALVAIVINAFKSEAGRKEVKEAVLVGKQEVKEAVKEVHTIVNNKADVSAKKIDDLEKKVAELLAAMAEEKKTAALLAQSAATAAATHSAAAPTAPTEVLVINPPQDPVPTTTTKKP